MSKYDEMSVEQLEECVSNLGIDTCQYCRFHGDCPGGVRPDGGGNPIYPLVQMVTQMHMSMKMNLGLYWRR